MSPWERTQALLVLVVSIAVIVASMMFISKLENKDYEYNTECYINW